MNYYLWISGTEHGPYTLEQIRAAVADGTINVQQTARTEDSNDWKPLSQIARVTEPKATPAAQPAQTPPKPAPTPATKTSGGFRSSSLVAVFQFFAVLNFIAAGIGLLIGLIGQSGAGWVVFASGIGSGFLLLGFATVIDSLQEMVVRLRNLERAATPTNGQHN